MSSFPITISDVFKARQIIAPYLQPTPLHDYHGLSQLLGAKVYVKHENHQPIGAFKMRGGGNVTLKQLREILIQ